MWPSLSVPHVDCTPSSKQFFRICLLLLWEKPLTTFSHHCSFEMRFWCSLMVLRAAGWLAGLVLYLDQAENSRPVVAIWLLCSWGWKRPAWAGWLEQRRGRVPCSLLGLRVRGAGLLAQRLWGSGHWDDGKSQCLVVLRFNSVMVRWNRV